MPSQSINPRTGEAFGPVIADTTAEQLDAIVADSVMAFATWSSLDAHRRAASITAIADTLDADAQPLAELADAESGLGLPRLVGEVARTTFQLRMFAAAVASGDHEGTIIDPAVAGDPPAAHPDLRRTLVPLGPVAVYGASNFPFAFSVLGGDTASALAAGCTVVAKAHPSHPQTSQRVADIARGALEASGAPAGVLGLVHGFDAGVALAQHPSITAGAFTGSTTAGRALFDLAMARPIPIPFYGELGSVNPVVVTPAAASRESLPTDYLASLTLGTGQFCTNPSLLVVPSGHGLTERIEAQLAGLGEGTLLNENVAALLARNESALAAIPGVRRTGEPSTTSAGWHATPRLLIADAATALREPQLLTTECFGPVGVVVEYDDEPSLLAVLARLEGCLASAVHGEADEPIVRAILPPLAAISGRVIWNGWPTGVAVTAGQHHGGPYPASTSPLHTSVGTTAMRRFQRPVTFQSFPPELLPERLRG